MVHTRHSAALKYESLRIVECYSVTFIDNQSNNTLGQDGQLTYYKTEKKVVLFGPNNKTIMGKFLHTTLPEPSWRVRGLERNKSKGSLTPKHEFLLADQFHVTVVRAVFYHEKIVKVAGEQLEGQRMREVILQNIKAQDGALAELRSTWGT